VEAPGIEPAPAPRMVGFPGGVALARGLEAGGVASCGKHFPGYGDTTTDSHLTRPRLPHETSSACPR
jgi:beta-glucosidase-like glycosyl hydrolase